MSPHASLTQILVIVGGIVIVYIGLATVIVEELRRPDPDPWKDAPFKRERGDRP